MLRSIGDMDAHRPIDTACALRGRLCLPLPHAVTLLNTSCGILVVARGLAIAWQTFVDLTLGSAHRDTCSDQHHPAMTSVTSLWLRLFCRNMCSASVHIRHNGDISLVT